MTEQAAMPAPKRAFPTLAWFRALPQIRGIRREDIWLTVGYFATFWILDAVSLGTGADLDLPWLARNWVWFAAFGCMSVAFRRTATTLMAVICTSAAVALLLANQAAGLLLVFELFFSLVLFGSPRVSLAAGRGAVGLSALLTLAVFALTAKAEPTVVAAVAATMTLLMPVEWAGNLRKAQRLAESESARAQAVHEASEHRLLAARAAHELVLERERQHMARELHDVLSGRLAAIALQSGAALHTPSSHTRVLAQIRSESVAGLDELNGMIRLLHTRALDDTAGRVADLPSLIETYRLAGAAITFKNSLGDDLLPLQLQTAIYRVAAESLVNATRHAPGTSVAVSLSQTTGRGNDAADEAVPQMLLRVSNDLPHSGESRGGSGTGIPSMHFRAAHAGGTIVTGPCGGRWLVELRLPAPNFAEPQPSPALAPEGTLA